MTKQTNKQRDNNLDYLRLIACILVIMIHVSSGYVANNMDDPNFSFTVGNFYDSISRICVPIFVLSAGNLALSNCKNRNYRYYYKKKFNHIGKPLIIWSVIYMIYSYIMNISGHFLFKKELKLLRPLKFLILGKPFYHLWYMYMLIGLIAVTPLILRLKEDIGEEKFFRLGIFCMVVSIPISFFSDLYWMIIFVIYLGYYILGYSLKYNKGIFNNKILIFGFISSTFLTFILTEIIVRKSLIDDQLYFYGYLSPFVIISSLCIYMYFLTINKKLDIVTNISKHTFNIYLVHAGILTSINIVLFKILKLGEFNPLIYVPLMVIFIFISSYVCSIILNRLQTIKNKINY